MPVSNDLTERLDMNVWSCIYLTISNGHIWQFEAYRLGDYWVWLNPLLMADIINGEIILRYRIWLGFSFKA